MKNLLTISAMVFCLLAAKNLSAQINAADKKQEQKNKTELMSIEEKVQSLLNPDYIQQKTDVNYKQDITILEQVIIFNLLDEKGNAKESVTMDERKIIEKKVKEYEKQKSISNRAGKIYSINSKLEVISVEEIKK